MSIFAYKLIPPRPTFAVDMTAEEGAVMAQHVAYWQELAERGVALVFGPVADPGGGWGLAVVKGDSERELEAVRDADPAVSSGVAQAAIYPMPGAITGSAVNATAGHHTTA
jgi:uncharacterized protein